MGSLTRIISPRILTFTATSVGNGTQANLAWTFADCLGNAATATITRSPAFGAPVTTTASAYVDTGLVVGTDYVWTLLIQDDRGLDSVAATVSINTSPPTSRRTNVGHWVDVPTFERVAFSGIPRAGVSGTSYGTNDRLDGAGVQGVFMRYRWIDLEPTPGNFTFGRIATELQQCRDIGASRAQRFGFVLLFEFRSFDGLQTLPSDLAQYSTFGATGSSTGYDTWRWHPTVNARFILLVQALAAAFDSHECWEGIATSETSTGTSSTANTVHTDSPDLPDSGYTATKFRDALIAESNAISQYCVNGRHFWYQNFLTGGNALINTVVTACQSNGMVMGGPDILPYASNLISNVYPRYTTFKGQLPLFCAAQNNSHATNTANPAGAANTTTAGPFDSMTSIWQWAVTNLHINYMLWTYRRTGTPTQSYHWNDDRLAIAANQSFQPAGGWVPP